MSYQQEKNCIHLLDLFKYIYSRCRVEQEAGEGAHEDGECGKNTEANKQLQLGPVSREEAGHTTNGV